MIGFPTWNIFKYFITFQLFFKESHYSKYIRKSQLNVNMYLTVNTFNHFDIIMDSQEIGIKRSHVPFTEDFPLGLNFT